MRVEKYVCQGCKKEHVRKVYENRSEAVADVFMELYWSLIWEKKKDRVKELSFEDFCKELVFMAVYNYHKNRRRIKVEKSCIESGH